MTDNLHFLLPKNVSKIYYSGNIYLNKSGKLSQDTPVLPKVVKLGHAPDKIQVRKTTKGNNSKIE